MRTLLAPVAAFLVLASGLAAPATAAPRDVTAARVDGADRIDTAAEVAELTSSPGDTSAAVLTAADAFADAVTGIGVARAAAAPVLLTWRDRLPRRSREALDRLGVQTVYLVGGEQAISPAVADQLEQDFDVRRVAGDDRYGTAAEVARVLATTGAVGRIGEDTTALLATGRDFPDALAAGPLAYDRRVPVLLTRPDDLPAPTSAVLDELGIQRVVVFGGSAVVSPGVVEQLRAAGLQVERIAGGDRTRTAAAVADVLLTRFGFTSSTVLLARGDDFADSLAAAPRGGRLRVPLLLAERPDALGAATGGWLRGQCPATRAVQAIGGRAAVTAATLRAAVDAAGSCSTGQRRITYETGTLGEVTADLSAFQELAADTLEDDRGWDLGNEIEFTEVADGGDFRLWLADPQEVAAAAAGCSARYSCRVGNDVYINEQRWQEATPTYAGRTLHEYRHYVINHEVGHWLGLGHTSCSGPGRPAAVMQQQSISLDGCEPNVWPLPSELQAVRARWLG